MLDKLPILMMAGGSVGLGVAAVIRAWFDGRSKLVRAERGDPEPLVVYITLPRILDSQLKK